MMKIIGIAILSVSIILFGINIYEKYYIRKKSLAMFIDILNTYLIELKLNRKTISDVILSYSNKSRYISECKKLLILNPLYQSVKEKNNSFSDLFLSKEDELIIDNFFKNCGKGDYRSELNLCNSTIEALGNLKQQAIELFKKTGPLAIKLSVVLAAWIIIILI